VLGERGLQREVERIARFLVPEEVVLRERLRVCDRGGEVEAAVRVHGEARAARQHREHRLDAPAVLASGAPPIFIFTTV
jgi:hypothetical protein